MNPDSIGDGGKPFDPETPEQFLLRGDETFHDWWNDAGVSRPDLDRETAHAVWMAAYEHNAPCIGLIYDGAETYADAVPMEQAELTCAVHLYHAGSIVLPADDLLAWAAEHEDHVRRRYEEHDNDPAADTQTIWIDHQGQFPEKRVTMKRPPHSSDSVLASARKEFAKWWNQLSPPATLDWRVLDQDRAKTVWRHAFVALWDELELVHDSAKAHAGVISDSASLELGYIVDRFHDGKLVLNVETLLEYWGDPRYVLDRRRTRDEIVLRIPEKPDSSN